MHTLSNIFYHCFCVNDYQQRFVKTYNKIVSSGLLQHVDSINLCCIGAPSFIHQLPRVKLFSQTDIFPSYEKFTLDSIVNFCKEMSGNILYLHSKGVTRSSNNVQDWIDLMEYFLIEKHELCLDKLKQYDVVGVNYSEEIAPHFSGNFWWAKAEYLKNKSPVINTKNDGEFWILNTSPVKYYEVYNSKVNHYKQGFSRNQYEHI